MWGVSGPKWLYCRNPHVQNHVNENSSVTMMIRILITMFILKLPHLTPSSLKCRIYTVYFYYAQQRQSSSKKDSWKEIAITQHHVCHVSATTINISSTICSPVLQLYRYDGGESEQCLFWNYHEYKSSYIFFIGIMNYLHLFSHADDFHVIALKVHCFYSEHRQLFSSVSNACLQVNMQNTPMVQKQIIAMGKFLAR